MRIAFSGTHRSGKSTLLERVAGRLPRYLSVEEPYYLLEEEGYECAESPSVDDFVAQLERSISSLEEAGAEALFDRCPADILAYLMTHENGSTFDALQWIDRVSDAMQTLDLVVFVPVEAQDRIALSAHDNDHRRMAVHEKLEEILLDDVFGFDVEVLRVDGDIASRAQKVVTRIERTRGPLSR